MLRIVYAGTPEFAVPALQALASSDHQVVAVYTQPDRPAGRGRKTQPSPVKQVALEAGLPVFQPQNFVDDSALEQLASHEADLMVVAAYGLILPAAVLQTPRLGCLNIHASLLPRWRGASPIQQAILAGDQQSGITLMQMDAGLDTGPIVMQRALNIDADWTAGQLHDQLAPLGADLLNESLDEIEQILARAQPQNDAEACYAPRLTKQQAEINWQLSAAELRLQILAYNPWPVSYTTFEGDSLRLWYARSGNDLTAGKPGEVVAHNRNGLFVSCADAVLQITELQFAGRKRCTAADALNARDLGGCMLGVD